MSENLCEICGVRPAVFMFKTVINGTESERRLCPECAKKLQIINNDGVVNPANIIAQALKTGKKRTQRTCICGTKESDLRKDFKLGCVECYTTFADVIDNFLGFNAIIGHKGKSPANFKTTEVLKEEKAKELMETPEGLRQLINEAVAEEDYERASFLQKKLKKTMGENNG